jgi:hypothetical protein
MVSFRRERSGNISSSDTGKPAFTASNFDCKRTDLSLEALKILRFID